MGGDLLLPEVKQQAGLHAQGKKPTYMAGFLYNKGEDWSDNNQQAFLDQISGTANRIEVAHEAIQKTLNTADDPAATIAEMARPRGGKTFDTPEEVDQPLNGRMSQVGNRRIFKATYRWVKAKGKPGEENYIPGYLQKQ